MRITTRLRMMEQVYWDKSAFTARMHQANSMAWNNHGSMLTHSNCFDWFGEGRTRRLLIIIVMERPKHESIKPILLYNQDP